jgi:hypothetical protein
MRATSNDGGYGDAGSGKGMRAISSDGGNGDPGSGSGICRTWATRLPHNAKTKKEVFNRFFIGRFSKQYTGFS